MSARVSLFTPVKLGEYEYLFFIVGWTDYQTELRNGVQKQIDAFGADLGLAGMVLEPYDQSRIQTADEIRAKSWPDELRKRFDSEIDPFMLIINTGFAKFDPQKDHWGIIWFSNFQDYASDIAQLFHKLARMARNNEDIFDYLRSVSRKRRLRRIVEFAKLAKVGKYFEFGKVQVMGVSIDVKSILLDIASAATG